MQTGEIIIYQAPDGQTSIDIILEDETVWLTQSQMQQLFQQTIEYWSKDQYSGIIY